MLSQEIIFAGFGGQGVLSAGKYLVYAGMNAGLNVSWLPSYGPEMRGGTANCSVVISDGSIGSPIVVSPDTLVVMNRPSLDKFEKNLKSKGLLILDLDIVNREPVRKDIEVIAIPAQTFAKQLGNKRIANMILLGVLISKTKIVSIETILNTLREHGKEEFYELNRAAVEMGAAFA